MPWVPPEVGNESASAGKWAPPETRGWAPPEVLMADFTANLPEQTQRLPGALNDPGDNADLLRHVVNNPVEVIKSLPEVAMGIASAPGKLAYAAAADLTAWGDTENGQQYGGNLAALQQAPEVMPANRFIGEAARTNPKLAVAANFAKALPELASLMAVNPSGTAGRLVALGFAADMIRQAKPLFDEYAAEYHKPEGEQDAGKLAELTSGVLQTFGFAPLAAAHGLGGVPKELAYARDVVRGNVPKGEARPVADRRATMPAEEGALVPPWAAQDFTPQTGAKNVPAGIKDATPTPAAHPPTPEQSVFIEPKPWELDYGFGGEMPRTPGVWSADGPSASPKPKPAVVAAPAKPAAVSKVEPQTGLVDVPSTPVSAGEIATRADLMQFKRMDEAKSGVNTTDKLEGQWDDYKAGNLLLWEPKDPAQYGLAPGQKYIVANGHHRVEFGQRAQRKGFNAQIVREADGYSAGDARMLAAEINIADGKGTIYDQAKFIRNAVAALGPDEAMGTAARIGSRGRAAIDIGTKAGDPLWDAFINEQIPPETVRAIANAAPGDVSAQGIGIRAAAQKHPVDFVVNLMKASKAEAGNRAQALDLFGNDDSAMQAMEAQAARASALQKDLRDRLQVLAAGKKAEIAGSEGIDVKNPAAIPARMAEIKAELARWENWPLQPDLVAKVRGEPPPVAAVVTPPEALPKLRTNEKGTGDLLQGADAPFNLAGERAVDVDRLAAEKAQAEANAKAQAAFEAKNQPEIQGLGGAIPAEFGGENSVVSNMFAAIDRDRAAMGKPPMPDTVRRGWDEDNTIALNRMNREPDWIPNLIIEVGRNPRPLLSWEQAGMVWHRAKLKAEANNALSRIAKAFDDGRREDLAAAQADAARFESQLLALDDVVGRSGTGSEAGRSLQAQKMGAGEDFSLIEMRLHARAANGGRPLSAEREAELVQEYAKIKEANDALTAHIAKLEADKAARMTDEAIAEMQAELKRRPYYSAELIKIAETVLAKLKVQADKSRQHFRGRVLSLSPEDIYHLGVIGAENIARFGLDVTKFGLKMVEEFGDGIKPYMQAVWERANLHLENEGAKYGDKAEPVKRLLRKQDELGKRENVIGGLKKAVKDDVPLSLQGDYIRRLMESFIEGGLTERNALVDAIHKVLTDEVGLDVSRREVMEAMSGYGRFKALNMSDVKVLARDIRGQLQNVLKLEDIQNRKPLPKTGIERRTPSDEERRLVQQVNEAKRKFGVVVSDPARQLKSALDAVKTRLKNQITDLEYQIATKQRTVKTRTPSPFDAETKLLEARRDELKAQFDEIFPPREMTDAQRAQVAQRTIERSIADYERRIAGGDFSVRGSKRISTPEIEALRARQTALREQWQELRDAADPGRSERASLQALKTRLATRTAEYAERLARKDFEPRVRREVRMDGEALKLKAEFEIAKAEYHRGLIRDRLANESTSQKIYRGVKEGLNLPRNVMASWDVSAVLRQGGFIALGNPRMAAQSLAPMFRALGSERAAVMVEQEILHRPNAADYKRAKLYLAPHEALHLSAMEEAMMSRLAGKIPGLRASNRAYITFLNKLRADSFDALKASIERDGLPLTQAELEAIGNYINVATGRGNLYKFTPAAEGLATAFFAPRLVVSRFQMLAGQPLYHGTGRTRLALAKEYGKFLTGAGVVLGLGALAGATVEADPRSSDFGKLKWGNTRVDVLGGLLQASVLVGRLATGKTKTMTGEVQPIRGADVPYGHARTPEVIGRFLRTKLSPVIGAAMDLHSGKNVVGEKVTPAQVGRNLLVPLSFQDIFEAMKDQGVAPGAALGVLSLFGAGLMTYDPVPPPEETVARQEMKKARQITPGDRRELREKLTQDIRAQMNRNPSFSNEIVQTAAILRAMEGQRKTNALQRAISPVAR